MMFNCEKKLKMNSILSNVFLKKENTCIKQVNDKIFFFKIKIKFKDESETIFVYFTITHIKYILYSPKYLYIMHFYLKWKIWFIWLKNLVYDYKGWIKTDI